MQLVLGIVLMVFGTWLAWKSFTNKNDTVAFYTGILALTVFCAAIILGVNALYLS